MSYIITDDKHYKDIANSIRSKMQTDREYYPKDMATAIDNIPSSADGTDNPVIGIYYTNPDDNGNPTKVKISGWVNPTGGFPSIFTSDNVKLFIKQVEFLNCNFVTLSNDLFRDCSSLMTVNLPNSLILIGQFAFYNCTLLTAINLPSSLTSIGQCAFEKCLSLATINLPNSLTSIGSYAFKSCTLLTTINLPNSLIKINQNAFETCSALTTINLPNSLTSIGSNVFYGCGKLKNVTLGNDFNCNNLVLSASTLYTRETILQWLNALADRTGQTANKLTIGATNLAKLTEEDILIATNKNWTLA